MSLTLPDATPPIGKIQPFSKIVRPFELMMQKGMLTLTSLIDILGSD